MNNAPRKLPWLRPMLSALVALALTAAPASALILGSNLIRFDNNTVLTADQAGSAAIRTTIVAGATQTQAGATQLLSGYNNVTTCATASDGVKLPTAASGKTLTVRNSGAAVLRVWPSLGDAINGMAANLSVDIPVKGELTFRAIDGTTWKVNEKLALQAPSTQKGSLVFAAADSAGNTVTTITNASQAAARTISFPDPGATASNVLLTTGAATALTSTSAAMQQVFTSFGTVTFDRSVKCARVALTTATTNILTWANPEADSILITKIVVDLTAASTTGGQTANFGTTAVSATTTSDTLIDGADISAAAAIFDNAATNGDAGTNGRATLKLATGKWVTGTASGTPVAVAGFAYIFYVNI